MVRQDWEIIPDETMITTEPLVSVLVTPYNQIAYLRQTLDSILAQVCRFDFEIVIGEDCSTDGTRELCLEYAAAWPDKIVLCLNEQNKGLLDNYFDIFLKARGKYLADCGGDDYWLNTDKLQQQVDLLEKHPEVSLVTGNWQLLEQKTGKITNNPSWIEHDWFRPQAYGLEAISNYLNTNDIPRVSLASSCFRADWAKEAYANNPELFRGPRVVCEDLPLTLCLLKRGPIYVSRNNWLVYRVLEKSLSHSEHRSDYMRGFAFSAYRQTLELAFKLGVEPDAIGGYLRRKGGDFALHAFLNEDKALMDQLTDLWKEYDLKFPFKQTLLRFLMPLGWLAEPIRKIQRNRHRTP
jgi:glycosyltransferase involved in cell wall biosynthesis